MCIKWQRLVFNKQIVLHMNYRHCEPKNSIHLPIHCKRYDNQLERRILESVLKKCPNISRINLPNSDNDVSLEPIAKYCRRVTKLVVHMSFSEASLMLFATKHGQWLEEFSFESLSEYSSDFRKKFRLKCPNIEKLHVNMGENMCPIIESDLKNLKVIEWILIEANESDVLKHLVRKYEKTLKGLDISIDDVSSDELKTCFAHISRFESLESLRIAVEFGSKIESIEECLQMLANKCTKLTKLNFHSDYCVIIQPIILSLL